MKKDSLGEFIIKKRNKKNISSRQLAISSEVSAAYMNDIEKGKRIPTFDVLKKIGLTLELDDEDMYKLLDLAAKNSNNRVPYDIVEYIMKNDSLRKCIRKKIKDNDYSGWEKVLESSEVEE
ncbi:MAG: helix-turn-helix transcriptional regulator [Firmicutes bacterium]|nr:helix-turn-helix transcriptional regulator [Bacillota bacterium]